MERNIETYEDLMEVFEENEASYFSFVYQSIMVHDFPGVATTTYDIIKEYLPRFFQSLNLKPTLTESELRKGIENSKGYKVYIEWQDKWLLYYKKKNLFDPFKENITNVVRTTRLEGKPLNQCYCRILSAHYIYKVLVGNELNEDFIYSKLLRTIPVEELNSWYKDDPSVYENIFSSAKEKFKRIGVKNLNNDLLYEILMNSAYVRKLKEKHHEMVDYLKHQSKTSIMNLKITNSLCKKKEISPLEKLEDAINILKTTNTNKIEDKESVNNEVTIESSISKEAENGECANEKKTLSNKIFENQEMAKHKIITNFDKELDLLLKGLGTGDGKKDAMSDFLLDIGNTLFELNYK